MLKGQEAKQIKYQQIASASIRDLKRALGDDQDKVQAMTDSEIAAALLKLRQRAKNATSSLEGNSILLFQALSSSFDDEQMKAKLSARQTHETAQELLASAESEYGQLSGQVAQFRTRLHQAEGGARDLLSQAETRKAAVAPYPRDPPRKVIRTDSIDGGSRACIYTF